ncbi:MAG: hypothetical protein ABIP99_16880 [Ilumatobacteraceae bacterium]
MSDAAAVPDHDGPSTDAEGGGGGYPSIIIQGAAIARIEAEMGGDTSSEVGGVLVGNAAPSTNFVLITGSLPAPQIVAEPPTSIAVDGQDEEVGADGEAGDADNAEGVDAVASAPPTFTLTASVLEDLSRQVAAAYPGQRIVGWYHSHPRAGIFLSAHDLYIQSAFFAQSWQVGYVYDPSQAQRGFFGWSEREVVRVPNWEVTSIAHASGADLPVNAAVASAAPGSSAPIVIGGPGSISTSSAYDLQAPGGGPVTVPPPKKRPVAAIIAAVAAVILIVIAAIALTGGDDTKSSTTSSSSPDSSVITTDASTPASETSVATSTADTETQTTSAVTTTTAAADGKVTTTTSAPVAITFPATPTDVAAPASRLGTGAAACTAGPDGSYSPLADCFVPLNNGNVMAFISGSLRCVDPNGQVVANEAQQFSVGVPDDPLVLLVDGALNATCLDLTYAKNVLAGGSDTLDGLCGSSGTQINDGTRRCLSQNLTSGAMVALVRSASNQSNLVASCKAGTGDATVTDIVWSDTSVGTSWRIESVVYQPSSNNFLASASRTGATATATLSCG